MGYGFDLPPLPLAEQLPLPSQHIRTMLLLQVWVVVTAVPVGVDCCLVVGLGFQLGAAATSMAEARREMVVVNCMMYGCEAGFTRRLEVIDERLLRGLRGW